MKKASENWLIIAQKDLKIAKVSLREEEPLQVIFHLHAALEKILKGISEEKGVSPPKIHSLKLLAVDTCQIKLEDHYSDLLKTLDKAFIDSRYPEDVAQFEEEYNLDYCAELVKEVEATFKWLKDILIKN